MKITSKQSTTNILCVVSVMVHRTYTHRCYHTATHQQMHKKKQQWTQKIKNNFHEKMTVNWNTKFNKESSFLSRVSKVNSTVLKL